jgi:hypothetical protein
MTRFMAISLVCATLSSSLVPRSVSAQTRCEPIAGGSEALAAVDAETRLRFVRETMRDQAARAKTWEWAWSGIGYGLAAGQYALVPLMPPEHRLEQALEATVALYLPASIFVLPLRVRKDDAILEQMLDRATAPGGVMSPCLALRRAEELLLTSAADEALRTGAIQQTVALVLSAGYTAFLWFAFQYVPGVIMSGGGAFVVSEIQIFTTPTGAVKGLERYKKGDVTLDAPPKVSWTLAPMSGGAGLAVVGTF